MRLMGTPFENSPDCKGVAFVAPGATHDMAVIEITGRYPKTGWVMNRKSYEIVYVVDGIGGLAQKDAKPIQLEAGDAVSVPPETLFAWDGDMTIVMSCQPAFTPEQYEEARDV